jgi:hypothetical protein
MHISTLLIAVALALAQETLARPVIVMVRCPARPAHILTYTNSPAMQQPEYRTIHVPGIMRMVRDLPLAPGGLDLLSALPLESLLGGAGSPLAGGGGGGGGGDSNGSEESAGGSGYGPADGGADVATGEDASGGNEDPSNTNNDAANRNDTAPPTKKAKHRE